MNIKREPELNIEDASLAIHADDDIGTEIKIEYDANATARNISSQQNLATLSDLLALEGRLKEHISETGKRLEKCIQQSERRIIKHMDAKFDALQQRMERTSTMESGRIMQPQPRNLFEFEQIDSIERMKTVEQQLENDDYHTKLVCLIHLHLIHYFQ